jgi:hypothetical protein
VPETHPDRIARHLATCRRLAELGMVLAEAAAAEAQHAPAPEPAHTPAQAAAAARLQINAAMRFARLARSVRQAIAMEQRILAANAEPAAPRHHDVPDDDFDHPAAQALRRAMDARRADATRANQAGKSQRRAAGPATPSPKAELFETATNLSAQLTRNTNLDRPLWPLNPKSR